jgi:hypothetical protein
MELDLNSFLYGLLAKRKRRILVLMRWHSNAQYVKGDTVYDVVRAFIDIMLHSPVRFSMHTDHFRIFEMPDLQISYEWLTLPEQEFVKKLFMARKQIFKQCIFKAGESGVFNLRDCRLPHTLPIVHRRELVRDFCFLLTKIPKLMEENYIIFILTKAVQSLLLREKPDQFVRELHCVLQGRNKLDNLLCVYI